MSEDRRKIENLERALEKVEARVREAEAREENERKMREEEQRIHQKTTLDEYLHHCHFYLYKTLSLHNKSKCSSGFATSVDGKYYPKFLRPWDTFANVQRQRHINQVRSICGERRLFNQESTIRDQGKSIERRPAGNEETIVYFKRLAVADPVSEILLVLQTEEALCQELQFRRLVFENSIRGIERTPDDQMRDGGKSEDTQERWRIKTSKTSSQKEVQMLPGNPDGFGIRTGLDRYKSPAFVYDFKAAHKFSTKYLEAAVTNKNLFLEVARRKASNKYPSDADIHEQEIEEARIAIALIQVFNYMICYGVKYGFIAAGKSIVFLSYNRTDLQTLYCHLCIPEKDVDRASPESSTSPIFQTAVAQMASFCLLSLRSKALQGDALKRELGKAEKNLKKWGDPYDDAARLLEMDDSDSLAEVTESTESDGSEFKSKAGPGRREYLLRSKSSSKSEEMPRKGQDNDKGDGPGGSSKTRIGIDPTIPMEPTDQCSEDEDATRSDSVLSKQYCTQACLLGLKRNGYLDENCPNVASHRAAPGSTRHTIDASQFTRLVSNQLRQNPYQNCIALDGWGKAGAIGVLFKLELAPYGYTFVSKGTQSSHIHYLEHETDVYACLAKLQGEVVPVHLGIVHLDEGYIFPGGARVFHMMLMSWGGEELTNTDVLKVEVQLSMNAVQAERIYHNDNRGSNLLWNDELQRIMVIDFHLAHILPVPKQHTQPSRDQNRKRKRQKEKGSFVYA